MCETGRKAEPLTQILFSHRVLVSKSHEACSLLTFWVLLFFSATLVFLDSRASLFQAMQVLGPLSITKTILRSNEKINNPDLLFLALAPGPKNSTQTFRAPPGYPSKIRGFQAQKNYFPWFRGTYRTFGSHLFMWKAPTPGPSMGSQRGGPRIRIARWD